MASYTSVNSYRKEIRTRMRRYIKSAENNAAKASFYLSGQLKSTAPIRSGNLAKSVRRRKTKNGYSVLAGYNKGKFNIGRYINQEITSWGRLYPQGVLNPTAKEYPWFTGNVEKAIKRYRAGYKKVRMSLRG